MRKGLIKLFITSFLTLSMTVTAFADTVQISVVENPNIDILLTTGVFDTDLSNFENDIKAKLNNENIKTVSFQTIETKTEEVDESKAADIFNSWASYGVSFTRGTSPTLGTLTTKAANSVWELNGDKLQNTSGSSATLDIFMSNDFHKTSREKYTARFGLATNNTSTHGEAWYFFRTDSTLKNAYALVWDNHSACGPFSNADYKLYLVRIKNGKATILKTLTVQTWTNGMGRYWDANIDIENNIATIEITGTNSTTWSNIDVSMESINTSLKDTEYTTAFGVFKYVGAYFSNITNTQISTRDFSEVLTEPTWRSDATHLIVNVDSGVNNSIVSNPEILARTLADDIHFIQWGSDENKTVAERFIALNENKGLFTFGSSASDYQSAIDSTAEYIKNILRTDAETQYVIIGKDTDLYVSPENLKTNAVDIEHPNGRWIVHHNYTYFDNNLGQSMQTETYTPDLMLSFDKPGAYDIYFDDILVKTVYAHRAPIADFSIDINNKTLTLASISYDEDSDVDNGYGKGIKSESWYYKEADDSNWTEGKLETLATGKTYVIKLEVEDMQGATTYTTKYVGAGNPVSYFLADKSQFNKYYNVTLTDSSYDPSGYDIVAYEWTLKRNKSVVQTYTVKNPSIDFVTLGIGDYTLSLKVKNSQNTWSDSYTRGFTVIEDTIPPSVTIDPTYCDWKASQDIHIQIEDNESGLDKWRYCYTQSQEKPAESEWSEWLTSADTTLTFDTDGEYYLHFEAYDNANNKLERTVGSYKITHPYTNKVNHRFSSVELEKSDYYTYDWGKWYSPTDEFKLEVNGFKFKDKFNVSYPVAGTVYNTGDRIKQPSSSIEFDFFYEPETYNIVYDYNIDCDEVDNPSTYTTLEGFKLQNPSKDGYVFMGWYLDGKLVTEINYNKSNNFDDFESFKNEMAKRLSGDIILKAVWNQTGLDGDCNVFATIGSEYRVTIPKVMVLKGVKDTSIEYNVTVEGDIAGLEIIKVVPDSNVVLKSVNKPDVDASIVQEKTAWAYDDLGNVATGTLTAEGLSAGKWIGNFNFNIYVDNYEGNVNSEESVEYQELTIPVLIQ